MSLQSSGRPHDARSAVHDKHPTPIKQHFPPDLAQTFALVAMAAKAKRTSNTKNTSRQRNFVFSEQCPVCNTTITTKGRISCVVLDDGTLVHAGCWADISSDGDGSNQPTPIERAQTLRPERRSTIP